MRLQQRARDLAVEFHSQSDMPTVPEIADAASRPWERFLDNAHERIAASITGHPPWCSCDLCQLEFDMSQALGLTIKPKETTTHAGQHAGGDAAAAPTPDANVP